jgi:hypothetical protein
MLLFRLALSIAIISLLSGCASVTGTTGQSVSVQTRLQNGKELKEAACDLTNSKGVWYVTTPGSVSIRRSNDDMQVVCKKEGYDSGRASVTSDTKGSMFGNIILGGGIGAIVDHSNGSAYEYPTLIQVVMGADTHIASPKDNTPVNTSPLGGGPVSTDGTKKEQPHQSIQNQDSSHVETKQAAKQTQQEKLKQVKDLYDKGLITKEIYIERQRKILEENY